MTIPPVQRRRLSAAAALFTLLGAAACSGSSPASTPAAPTATVTAPASADPAAAAALARAVRATKAVRSYTFRAVQTLSGGSRPQVTVLSGRAVRPAAITYNLKVGTSTQEVVRVGGRTYLRVPPSGWKALTKPAPSVDPLASLLPLLTDLQQPRLTGSTLTGQVPAVTLSKARLAPAGASPGAMAPVSLVLDKAGRVASLSLRLSVQAGKQRLELDGRTTFGSFNQARPIKAPGKIKPKP